MRSFTYRFDELNGKVNCEVERNEQRAEEFSYESVIMNTKYGWGDGVSEDRAARSLSFGRTSIATRKYIEGKTPAKLWSM
jgi:hypothetical protein